MRSARLLQHGADKRLRLASARTVADGDRVGTVFGDELADVDLRLDHLLRPALDVDDAVLQEFSGRVQRDTLAARADAGVDSDDLLFTQRRGEQEVAQVLGKDLDRRAVRLHLLLHRHIDFDTGRDQALVSVVDRFTQRIGERRCLVQRIDLPNLFKHRHGIARELHAQHAFRLSSPDGEEPVGGNIRERFAEIVILLELRRLLRFRFHDGRNDLGGFLIRLAYHAAHLGVLGNQFRHNVLGSGQRAFRVGNAFFRIDKEGGSFRQRDRLPRTLRNLLALFRVGDIGRGDRMQLGEDEFRKRFESLFARDHRTGTTLGLVGKVEVFQRGL